MEVGSTFSAQLLSLRRPHRVSNDAYEPWMYSLSGSSGNDLGRAENFGPESSSAELLDIRWERTAHPKGDVPWNMLGNVVQGSTKGSASASAAELEDVLDVEEKSIDFEEKSPDVDVVLLSGFGRNVVQHAL